MLAVCGTSAGNILWYCNTIDYELYNIANHKECYIRVFEVKAFLYICCLFTSYGFLNILYVLISVIKVIKYKESRKRGSAGYKNTMGGMIMYTLNFAYHIQWLSWIQLYCDFFDMHCIITLKFQYHPALCGT